METPTLPLLSENETDNGAVIPKKDKLRSSLVKTLSNVYKTAEEETPFGEDHNNFIIEEDNIKKILAKPIVKNENRNSSLKPKIKKELKFSQTEVHEVENWKEYNKPKRCCFFFVI